MIKNEISDDVYIITELAKRYKEVLRTQNISEEEKEKKLIDFIKKALNDYKELDYSEFKKKYKSY